MGRDQLAAGGQGPSNAQPQVPGPVHTSRTAGPGPVGRTPVMARSSFPSLCCCSRDPQCLPIPSPSRSPSGGPRADIVQCPAPPTAVALLPLAPALTAGSMTEFKYAVVGLDGAVLALQQGNNSVLAVRMGDQQLEVLDAW